MQRPPNYLRKILLSLIVNIVTCTTLLSEYYYALDFNPSPLSFWTVIPASLSIAGLIFFIAERDRPAKVLTILGILAWLSFMFYVVFLYKTPLLM